MLLKMKSIVTDCNKTTLTPITTTKSLLRPHHLSLINYLGTNKSIMFSSFKKEDNKPIIKLKEDITALTILIFNDFIFLY